MRFLLSLVSLLSLAFPALAVDGPAYSTTPYKLTAEDHETLKKVEDYLSNIHTITAQFTQAAPDGSVSSGRFFLQRPGKLRMEYDPPTPVLMVASGNYLVFYDKELDQVSRVSLDSTLVGFLAQDKVRFDDSVIITSFEQTNNTLRLSLIQSKRVKDGSLTLEFADNPLSLRNMVVTDSGGQKTTVSLNNARFDLPLDKSLFIFNDPHLGGSAHKH